MKPARFLLAGLAISIAFATGPLQAKKQQQFVPTQISPDTVIYEITDQMPLFRGRPAGSALAQWIGSQIRYSEYMIKRKIQGKVWASFVVEPDRSISNLKILSSPDDALSFEVLRVLRNMPPAWSPGINNQGEAVRVIVRVPVTFRLN